MTLPIRALAQRFDPRRIADCVVFLDASVGSSITLDTTLSTTTASEWRDLSGNGWHVQQATKANQPAFTSAARNGLSALRLTAGNFMSTANNFTLTGNPSFTTFVVARKTTAIQGSQFGWGEFNGSLGAFGLYDDNSLRLYAFAGNNNFAITAINTNEWLLHSFVKPAGAINGASAFRNGTNCATGTPSANTPNITSNPLTVGRWANYTLDTFEGDFAALVIYSRALSVAERQWVERGLMLQWGIT